MVLVDDRNFTTEDMKLNYTVKPADYSALAVDLDVYKKPTGGQETLATVLYGDKTQGEWSSAFVRGSVFDAATLYSAEAVLNPGSDMEVRGPDAKVELPVARLRVLTDESASREADEVKFGDGSKASKRYKIEMISAALQHLCNNSGGMNGTIRSIDGSGTLISSPGDTYYPTTFNLDFTPGSGNCIIGLKDSPLLKDIFIVSNMSKATLAARLVELQSKNTTVDLNAIAVLYGGLGNKLQLTINGTSKNIPIEPVGVIVLGIDGLRQDVLYPETMDDKPFENVNDPNATYYIDARTLPGIGRILLGDPQKSSEQKYIMLPRVTTIFPSITFAAWASIYTGKQPSDPVYGANGAVIGNNGTGIVGNEFFARDLYHPEAPNSNTDIPGLASLPSGMVTLDPDGGSMRAAPAAGFKLKALNILNESAPLALGHVMPAEFLGYDTLDKKLAASAPAGTLKIAPIWGEINNIVTAKYQSNLSERCDKSEYECRTVSMFNQYVRGVDWWGTPSLSWKKLWELLTGGSLFDTASTNEALDFVSHYFDSTTPKGKRKRFPALFSVYLPGLDHDAHLSGMGHYLTFFQTVVDEKIGKIVDALKEKDEFDNKIFIVVSDHGETAMPTNLKYVPSDSETGSSVSIDMSCGLDAKHFSLKAYREDERANNNLHIWELVEMFAAIGKAGGPQYKILAPSAIQASQKVETPYGGTSTIDKANVIAALNGPMAHIYLKGSKGWQDDVPDVLQVSILAKYLKRYLQEGGSNIEDSETKENMKRLLSSVDRILIRVDGEYRDFLGLQSDESGAVVGPLTATIDKSNFDSNAYILASQRVAWMNNSARSGDIILIMKDAISGTEEVRYTTAYACKAWHGSLNRTDSYVPLIAAYPGGNKAEIAPLVDATPDCNSTTGCIGNWTSSDLIKAIMKRQYEVQ